MSTKIKFLSASLFSKAPTTIILNLKKPTSFSPIFKTRSYSSIDDSLKLDTDGNKSFTILNPEFVKDPDRFLLAKSRFYCRDGPLLGVNPDGTFNNWSLYPHLSTEQLNPKTLFSPERNDTLTGITVTVEIDSSDLDYHPLIAKFNGDATQAANDFFDRVLLSVTDSDNQRLTYRLRRSRNSSLRKPIVYRATSVLRKRRLKMNKHKYRKLRKRTRSLRKRLGK